MEKCRVSGVNPANGVLGSTGRAYPGTREKNIVVLVRPLPRSISAWTTLVSRLMRASWNGEIIHKMHPSETNARSTDPHGSVGSDD